MLTLPEIADEVRRRALLIGAADELLPTYNTSEGSGRPHIEVDEHGYHFVISERGSESSRATTTDLDALLFRVFESITFTLANQYAAKRQIPGQDYRRNLFARQVELLAALSPVWATRRAMEHANILRDHPFDDAASARAALTAALRAQGQPVGDAWNQAVRAMPLPISDYSIVPGPHDTLTYSEGAGQKIEFTSGSLAQPPRVKVPSANLWAAHTPSWAHERRAIIIERLRSAGCIVLEEGELVTSILSPDGSFRIDSEEIRDDRGGGGTAVYILSVPAGTLLLYLPYVLVVDVLGFDDPRGVTLQLSGRTPGLKTIGIDLKSRTFRLPPTAPPRSFESVRDALEADTGGMSLVNRSAASRPRSKSMIGNAAMTIGSLFFAVGSLWLTIRSKTLGEGAGSVGGLLLFGWGTWTGSATLLRDLKAMRASTVPFSRWMRFAPYLPLMAALAEAPWFVLSFFLLLFIVGDAPHGMTDAKEHLFLAFLIIPSATGVVAGAFILGLGLVRNWMQRTCFLLGCVLCILFLIAVATGRLR